ncbi:MAG: DUF4266 domain-containing protein [Kangiella sp.]|jgi:hypothetical protein|nr:DUF4266 domain-containing protein [Kangiella sp.]
MKQKSLLLLAILGFSLLSGCSTMGVNAWEKDLLAKPEMALDEQPLTDALDDHIYFSKEASSGGRAYAGGGCGCN